MAYGDRTNCKACGREIVQLGGGHRQRLYCDDNCKQAAFRARREQEHKDAITQRWEAFTPETRGFLDWLMSRYSEDLTTAVEAAINRECGHYSAQFTIATIDAEKLAALEQEVVRYRKVINLDHRSLLVEQMMVLGEKLGYKRLINYDIKPGPDAWRDFIDRADEELLALAIVTAQHFYEGLQATHSSIKHGSPASHESESQVT